MVMTNLGKVCCLTVSEFPRYRGEAPQLLQSGNYTKLRATPRAWSSRTGPPPQWTGPGPAGLVVVQPWTIKRPGWKSNSASNDWTVKINNAPKNGVLKIPHQK